MKRVRYALTAIVSIAAVVGCLMGMTASLKNGEGIFPVLFWLTLLGIALPWVLFGIRGLAGKQPSANQTTGFSVLSSAVLAALFTLVTLILNPKGVWLPLGVTLILLLAALWCFLRAAWKKHRKNHRK